MVEAEKVGVRVIRYRDDVPYLEYAPPKTSPEHGASPNERYIEVSTNERYCVEVKLLRGFKFLGHPKVEVQYTLDNVSYYCTLSRDRPSNSHSKDCRCHREDTLAAVYRTINRRVMKCGLKFGQLESDDDVTLGDKEIAQAVDEAGRIVVKLRRGRFGGKARESSEPRAFDPLDDVDDTKTCKEVVYKHNVSHVTTHLPIQPVPEPVQTSGGYRREWLRAEGPEGKSIVFTIRYRSRAALVALDIIKDVGGEPSQSETADAAAGDHDSVGQPDASVDPEPMTNHLGSSSSSSDGSSVSSRSFDSQLDNTREPDEYSSDEDSEENNGSDDIQVTDREERNTTSVAHHAKDAILVSDGEEGDSRSNPHNSNNAIMISDGEESDSDSDDHDGSDQPVEQQQETPGPNEQETHPSRSNERSVEPRQTASTQNGEETQPSSSNNKSMDQQRQEAEIQAEIRQRVAKYMARGDESGQARAITAVKRKITDEQMEDFPAAKRLLETLLKAADV